MAISLNNNPHRLTPTEMKEQAQKAEEELNRWKGRLIEDPLTIEQQLRIKIIFDYFLLSSKLQIVYDHYSQPLKEEGYPHRRISFLENLIRGKATAQEIENIKNSIFEPDLIKHAPEQTTKEWEIFQKIIHNPASHAELLGIDQKSSAQVFAARTFISSLLTTPSYHYRLTEIHANYRKEMTSYSQIGGGINKPISAKNKLLMENDPVRKLPTDRAATAIDHVLARTFFITPVQINRQTDMDEKGHITKETVSRCGPSREEARKMIENALVRLQQNEYLNPIIQALGILIQKENIHFFFGGSNLGAHDLGEPYGVKGSFFNSTQGFYDQDRSVVCSSLINPSDNMVITYTLGTFIHESLHMLFHKIVKNSCDPTTSGSKEEEDLNEALSKDRKHRAQLNLRQLTSKQQSVWNTFVDSLENENYYFEGRFNPANPKHLHIMRLESIVRPLEQITQGASPQDLEVVCPHLWNFFKENSKKLIKQYLLEEAHLISAMPIEKDINGSELPVKNNSNSKNSSLQQPENHANTNQTGSVGLTSTSNVHNGDEEQLLKTNLQTPVSQPSTERQQESVMAKERPIDPSPLNEKNKPTKLSFLSASRVVFRKIFQIVSYPFHSIRSFFQRLLELAYSKG